MATPKDSYTTVDPSDPSTSYLFDTADLYYGQTFTAGSSYSISSIKLPLSRVGNPGTITVYLYATSAGLPTGSALKSGTVDGSTLSTDQANPTWKEITLSAAVALVSGTKYAFAMPPPTGGLDTLYWQINANAPGYTGGNTVYSDDAGSTWNTLTHDGLFETYAGYVFSPPTDRVTIKKLVVAAANKIFYESV